MSALSDYSGINGSPLTPAGGVITGTVYLVQNVLYLALNNVAATGVPFIGATLFNTPGKYLQNGVKVTAQAWAAGQNIYWDNTAKNFTTVISTNVLVGVAANAQLTTDVLADIILGKQVA